MANSDKNILITPSRSLTTQPSIVFTGQGNVPITLKLLDDSYGTISFEGSAGQLFSINNNLTTGVIFAVNDVSGIPSIDVNADGTVRLAPFSGTVYSNTLYALPKTVAGAGNSVTIQAGNGLTSGAGGNINLFPGLQATTGGNGKVVVKPASNTTDLILDVQTSAGATVASVDRDQLSVTSINISNSGTGYIKWDTSANGVYRGATYFGIGGNTFNMGFYIHVSNSTGPQIRSAVVDGAGVLGSVINHTTGLANLTAKLLSIQNNSVEVVSFSGNGYTVISPQAKTGTQNPSLTITGPAHTALTASTESNDVYWNLARTVQFATGALTLQRAIRIAAPTYSAVAASTITTAATMQIDSAPVAGTNVTITNQIALRVLTGVAAAKGIVVQGASSQSGYFLEAQNNGGSSVFYVDSSGGVYAGGNLTLNNSFINNSYTKEANYLRAAPIVVGDYVEVCEFTRFGCYVEITATCVGGGGIGMTQKKYQLSAATNGFVSPSFILTPISMTRQSGYETSFDFEMEIYASNAAVPWVLRLRRTAGTAARNVAINVKFFSAGTGDTLTTLTGTGTSGISAAYGSNDIFARRIQAPTAMMSQGTGTSLEIYAGAANSTEALAGSGGSLFLYGGASYGNGNGGDVQLRPSASTATDFVTYTDGAVIIGKSNTNAGTGKHWFAQRTIPATQGDYVEVATLWDQTAGLFEVDVLVWEHTVANGFRKYRFNNYYLSSGILQPCVDKAGAGLFELEYVYTGTTGHFTLRLRRTASTGATWKSMIHIRAIQSFRENILGASGTGTSAVGNSLLATTEVSPTSISPMAPVGNSGAGNSMTVQAGSGVGTGAGGSLILRGGAQATSGGDGTVIARAASATAGVTFRVQNSSSTDVLTVSNTGFTVTAANSASGLSTYSIAKTVLGGVHFANGAGTNATTQNEAAITFMGGSTTEAQAGIYVLNNNVTGTSMGFATTDNYTTGPQLAVTISEAGVVNFPRAVPTYAGNPLVSTTSGTPNYVTKFTATSTLGNSTIFDDGTNVGVATASPTTGLDVNGGLRVRQTAANKSASLVELSNRNGSWGMGIHWNAYYDGSWKRRTADYPGQLVQDNTGNFLIYTGATGAADSVITWNAIQTISNPGMVTFTPVAGTGTQSPSITLTAPAHTALTASTESHDVYFNLGRTVQFATGALTLQRAMRIAAPTYSSVAASTITTAATVQIDSAPVAGTNATISNPIALRVLTGVAAARGIMVVTAAAQTANSVEVQNSSSVVMFSVASTGKVTTNNGIDLGGETTATGPFNIVVTGSGSGTVATKGTGFGRNLIIKAGDTDNSAGKSGGDVYIRAGAPTAPATVYGDIIIADTGGNVSIGATTLVSKLYVISTATTQKTLVVKKLASQTVNLFEQQNDSGTAQTQIDASGYLSNNVGIRMGIASTEAGPYTIEVTGSGGSTPATKGTGYGRDLIIKGGNSDNTAGKVGGDLYLRAGPPASPATQYGDIYIGDTGGYVALSNITATTNTPASFSADQNNLVLNPAYAQRLSASTTARTITGIAPFVGALNNAHRNGMLMRIYNVGTWDLVLSHNSVSSSAANRFFCVQASNITIATNDYAELMYDGTDNGSGAAGWRVH
jgi:hypothetical protein